MQVDAEAIWKAVNLFGLPLLLVIAFIKGWIVPGYLYEQVRASEREFKDMAFRGTDLLKRVADSTERTAERAGGR